MNNCRIHSRYVYSMHYNRRSYISINIYIYKDVCFNSCASSTSDPAWNVEKHDADTCHTLQNYAFHLRDMFNILWATLKWAFCLTQTFEPEARNTYIVFVSFTPNFRVHTPL